MTLEVRWVPDAVEDMQDGHTWYEDREPGLGRDFAVAVFDALDQATRFPLIARRYEHVELPDLPEVRNAQLERFTEYGVVYAVLGNTFWILAVAHSKRQPGYWASRLSKLPKS